MTALAGFWALDSGVDSLSACQRMLKAQAVYAPAAPVAVRAGDAALGRRLYQLLPEDVRDRGPARRDDGRWTVVADARLDNRGELAAALGLAPADAATLPDAALILRAVERWEEEAADRLLGDFAFAAWNQESQRLLLVRDYAGARPLYFHRGKGFLAFSSMAKGLHALPEVPRAPDRDSFQRFLALVPEDGNRTFFEGIERVPPAHVAVFTRSALRLRRYWDPKPEPLRLRTSEEYHEALRAELNRAVAVRLRGADGGVASHLSGGLDSSAVTSTAARLLAPDGRVAAYTAVPGEGFDGRIDYGRFADEGPHAAAVAALYPNIDHVLVRTAGRSPFEALERNAFLYERPMLNLCNGVWIDAILDDAKGRGLRVLLTGQAGNMSFSFNGFERLSGLFRRGRFVKLAREALALRRHGTRLQSSAAHAVGPYLPAWLWLAINRWQGRSFDMSDYTVLNGAAADKMRAAAAATALDPAYRPRKDAVETRLWVMARVDPGNYNKGILGGWGIDMRDPSADRRLLELCLSIPLDQYLRNGHIRALARGAFADRLPPVILNETRKGLQAADWYEGLSNARGDAAEQVSRLAELAPAAGIFDTERMRRLIEEWPEADWNSNRVSGAYRLALLRGISGGHFLRKVSGAN